VWPDNRVAAVSQWDEVGKASMIRRQVGKQIQASVLAQQLIGECFHLSYRWGSPLGAEVSYSSSGGEVPRLESLSAPLPQRENRLFRP
jgi:hypothetical protein